MYSHPESANAQEPTPFDQPTASQHGAMFELAFFLHGLRRQGADPILQSGDWSEKLRKRIWNLGGPIDVSVQESSNNVTSCASWCLLAANTRPQQTEISCTILSQADWRAVRAVARCEFGLLPCVRVTESGSRIRKWTSEKALRVVRLQPRILEEEPIHLLEVFTSSRSSSSTHEQQRRGALLGPPVPTGRNLKRRLTGQSARTCVLARHAFVSLDPRQPFDSRKQTVLSTPLG